MMPTISSKWAQGRLLFSLFGVYLKAEGFYHQRLSVVSSHMSCPPWTLGIFSHVCFVLKQRATATVPLIKG